LAKRTAFRTTPDALREAVARVLPEEDPTKIEIVTVLQD
jgi:hypothetical protein